MGLLELLMGVETPISPPKMIDTAAPDGAPPRRIRTVEIIIYRFSWFGCELPFMCGSSDHFFKKLNARLKIKNQTLIDPDHIFNHDHDRDEKFSFKV